MSVTLASLFMMFISLDMSSALLEMTSDLKSTPCVVHALQVWTACSLGNYHQFFKLYKSAPNLSGRLMDLFVGKERKKALLTMTKAYVYVLYYLE